MASEERLRELEQKYDGFKVYDSSGDKIGKVDDLFIDDSDREEYIGVKMGFLGTKSTLIPMDIVRVNEAEKAVEVSESKDHVKDAPSFDDDEEITPEYEDRIRSHFGLESTGASSARGSYTGYSDDESESERGYDEERDHESGASSDVDTEYGERTDSSEESGRDPVEDRMRESSARSEETSSERYDSERDPESREYREEGSGEYNDEESSSATSEGVEREESSGFEDRQSGGEGAGESETREIPTSRQTEETETFQEGGRTKVRRRVIREEVFEEDSERS